MDTEPATGTARVEFALALAGPAGSGKTEFLRHLLGRLRRGARGGLISFPSPDGPTLLYDFLLLDVGAISGVEVLGELYALPGRDRFWLAERMILQHADGVLFVADGSGQDGAGSVRAFRRVRKVLEGRAEAGDPVPLVVFANKRDLARQDEPLPLAGEAGGSAGGPLGEIPVVPGSVTRGEGVLEALKIATAATLRGLAGRGARAPGSRPGVRADGEGDGLADVRRAGEIYLRTFSSVAAVYSPHSDRYLAEVVTRLKLLDADRVAEAVAVQRTAEMAKLPMRLDEILLRRGFLAEEDVRTALQVQAHGEVIHEEILYGKIAIESGFTDFASVKRAIATQKSVDFQVALGPLLVAGGQLSRRQHREILVALAEAHRGELEREGAAEAGAEKGGTTQFLKVMARGRKTAAYFGNLAVRYGFVTPEQLESALEVQRLNRRKGVDKYLGVILQEEGFLSERQVEIICQSLQGEIVKNPIEGYKIEAELGRGAMGLVYAARQMNLDRIVALKVLDPRLAMDDTFIERFQTEARAAAQLNHPNIVQAFDVGRSRGYYYFAMEYVEGQTVKQILEEKGAVPPLQALDISIQVLRALAHAEAHGLVHRDVKPANVMLTPEGIAKLCDLGLARRIGAGDEAEKIVGSPYTIAPEQIERRPDIDSRADVYALGATLYHMLVGKPPFEGKTAEEIFVKHLTQRPPDPSEANAQVPKKFAPILKKMMEKDRDERYPSAAETLQALKDLKRELEGEATGASEGLARSITRKIKTVILRRTEP
ncbi:MAG: protein kinase [Planctomycetales bacterium]|nr:protein kinase [Planctomycetales bacterium]